MSSKAIAVATVVVIILAALAGAPSALALPDLTPEIFDIELAVGSVDPGDVVEGCAGGENDRLLLHFSLRSRNLGPSDLVLGDPQCPDCSTNPGVTCGNPLFECSTAHGHPHFESFVGAELVDASDTVVAVGHKQGFCLLDSECANPQFTCGFQGISAGCADIYGSGLPCQYIDLTDTVLPDGSYTLRVTIDPDGAIAEADEANNTTTAVVTIGTPEPPEPPTCPVYRATDLPRPIPDLGSATSSLSVPAVTGTIERVRVVDLEGTHTFVGDLAFHLLSPDGSDIAIMDGVCGGDADFDLDLADSAATEIPCPPTDGGLHVPSNPLAVLQGEDPEGAWQLRVDDLAADDDGTLTSFGLEICTTCGNGTLESGEVCDDGNNTQGDCCAADCQAIGADGNPCSSNQCLQGSTCQAGVCTGGTSGCGPCLVCDQEDGCVPPTGLSCHDASSRGSTLALKHGSTAAKASLSWHWKSSVPLALLDFGSPTTVTDLDLCLYDQNGLRFSATAPAAGTCSGDPCWRTAGGQVIYDDARERSPDGLAHLLLRPGDVGKARIVGRGGGPLLSRPTLPLAPPLKMRMVRSGGPTCFEADFDDALRNDAKVLRARSR
jgi:cysteine-rich repeat protein